MPAFPAPENNTGGEAWPRVIFRQQADRGVQPAASFARPTSRRSRQWDAHELISQILTGRRAIDQRCRELSVLPLPSGGEGWGEGVTKLSMDLNPSPHPSPYGGGSRRKLKK